MVARPAHARGTVAGPRPARPSATPSCGGARGAVRGRDRRHQLEQRPAGQVGPDDDPREAEHVVLGRARGVLHPAGALEAGGPDDVLDPARVVAVGIGEGPDRCHRAASSSRSLLVADLVSGLARVELVEGHVMVGVGPDLHRGGEVPDGRGAEHRLLALGTEPRARAADVRGRHVQRGRACPPRRAPARRRRRSRRTRRRR